jgi:hypothetical protein
MVAIEQTGRKSIDPGARDLPDTVHDQVPSSSQAMVDPSDEAGQVKLTLILKNNSDRIQNKETYHPIRQMRLASAVSLEQFSEMEINSPKSGSLAVHASPAIGVGRNYDLS